MLVFLIVNVRLLSSDEANCISYYDIPPCIIHSSRCLLPTSRPGELIFRQAIFGMNVHQFAGNNVVASLAHYFAVAIPLTIATVWVIVAFQVHHIDARLKTWTDRLLWPIMLPRVLLQPEGKTDEESPPAMENANH